MGCGVIWESVYWGVWYSLGRGVVVVYNVGGMMEDGMRWLKEKGCYDKSVERGDRKVIWEVFGIEVVEVECVDFVCVIGDGEVEGK